MVTEEEHETDKEHKCHKHEEEDMKFCRPVGQVPLEERNRTTRSDRVPKRTSSKAPNAKWLQRLKISVAD